MNDKEIELLLEKYIEGTCTPEEKQLLELWFAKKSTRAKWEWADNMERQESKQRMYAHIQDSLCDSMARQQHKSSRMTWKWSVAAVVLLLISAGLWLFVERQIVSSNVESEQIAIGDNLSKEGVTLLLSNGSQLSLNDVSETVPYDMGGVRLRRSGQSELLLEGDGSDMPILSKLIVPKGKTFRMVMDDGTRIWVNAASTITFSSDKKKKERYVVLEEGEAYFEVAKDKERPFRVSARGTEIEVIGTSFNINAYRDERRVTTTLSEGRVKVSNGSDEVLLRPFQQAISEDGGSKVLTARVDLDQVLVWQKEYFVFDNKDIVSIMKDISRWYDVEVTYEGTTSRMKFGGTFSKKKDLVELLGHLESLSGDIRFKQIGRRIIVMS